MPTTTQKRSRIELQERDPDIFGAIYRPMKEEEKPKRQIGFTTEDDK